MDASPNISSYIQYRRVAEQFRALGESGSAEYCDERVCLSASISPELQAGFYTDFFVFGSPMAVAQSFSDGISTSSLMDDIIVAQDGQYAGMSTRYRYAE